MKIYFIVLIAFINLITLICDGKLNNINNDSIMKVKNDKNKALKSYIVHLHVDHTHESFEKSIDDLFKNKRYLMDINTKITHKFSNLLHGLAIEGVSLEDLQSLPGSLRVVPNTIKSINSVYSWGLDRIDQLNLELDNNYNSYYKGRNVDVYIVDTGLDTTHQEFNSNIYLRTVKNLYDAYDTPKTNPGANTDRQGHGTHCAGTVGGNTVGVSPGANLYGVRVLDDDGSGSTADIVSALEWVLGYSKSTGHRSVVSMSLGGPCESDDCSVDSLVMATESLITNSFSISVAAGNEGCNACNGSPNAAPNAFNVGASDIDDYITYFSNFGKCVDIFAPGFDILSACALDVCGDHDYYQTMSGTSMATPHVAGVLAQLLEKKSNSTNELIAKALACDSSKEVLHLDYRDTSTRDLLLQVPKQDTPFGTCNLGEGCTSDCASEGICLPAHQNVNNGDNSNICHCNVGYYGNTCDSTDDNMCNTVKKKIKIDLYDSEGDGWTFTNFVITNVITGLIADSAYDALCYDNKGQRSYCLPNGLYNLDVNRGYYPIEVSFKMCGVIGGAPFSGQFQISNDGYSCHHHCSSGSMETLTLYDNYDDGWEGAYYATYNSDGKQLFGGTLESGGQCDFQQCLPVGCSYMMLEEMGDYPEEISFEICGFIAFPSDIVTICVDPISFECTASSNSGNNTCRNNQSNIPFYMFDYDSNGWSGSKVNIKNLDNSIMYSNTLINGFELTNNLCLDDGCYDVNAIAGAGLDEYRLSQLFWNVCGFRGTIPFNSAICVEKDYDLCYGLTGCVYTKSYSHKSDENSLVVSHFESSVRYNIIDIFENVHSVYELCELSDGCYDFYVGSGDYNNNNERGQVNICDEIFQIPFSTNICLSKNATKCLVKDISLFTCPTGKVPHVLLKLDQYGDGWNGANYEIRKDDELNEVIYLGTLSNGEYDKDPFCFEIGKCYTFDLTSGSDPEEIIWQLCGYVNYAPISSSRFCITSTGCSFDNDHLSIQDDDFPLIYKPPTFAPTVEPTEIPTFGPTSLPTTSSPTEVPSLSPTYSIGSPTPLPSVLPTAIPSVIPTAVPTLEPTLSPTTKPTHSPVIGANMVEVATFSLNVTLKVKLDNNNLIEETTAEDLIFLSVSVHKVLADAGLIVWDVAMYDNHILLTEEISLKANQYDNLSQNKRKLFLKKLNNKIIKVNSDLITGHINCIVLSQIELNGIPSELVANEVNIQMQLSIVSGDLDRNIIHAQDSLYNADTEVESKFSNIMTDEIKTSVNYVISTNDKNDIPTDDVYESIWPSATNMKESTSDRSIAIFSSIVTLIFIGVCYEIYKFIKKKKLISYSKLDVSQSGTKNQDIYMNIEDDGGDINEVSDMDSMSELEMTSPNNRSKNVVKKMKNSISASIKKLSKQSSSNENITIQNEIYSPMANNNSDTGNDYKSNENFSNIINNSDNSTV
jgi:subtilisin family serine protease